MEATARAQEPAGFRLSPQQRALWLAGTNGRPECAQCVLLLEGEVERERLRRAVEAVVDRHDILRTTFQKQPWMRLPVQVIADRARPAWRELDLPVEPGEELDRAPALDRLLGEERLSIDDLAASPLVRFALARLSPGRSLLLCTLPALCADPWTLRNLAHEIGMHYGPGRDAIPLEGEPIQYVQFSEWQHGLLDEEDADEGRSFWQDNGGEAPALLALPWERGGLPSQETALLPVVAAIQVNPAVTVALARLAENCDTELPVLLLASWQIYLWRITGETEVGVEALFDGRKFEELYEAFGLFAKHLPIRMRLQADFTARQTVRRVGRAEAEARQWQEYYVPQEQQAEALLFEFEDRPERAAWAEARCSLYRQSVGLRRFRCKLLAIRSGADLHLEIHFDPAAFARVDLERAVRELARMLSSMAEEPDTAIGRLDLLTDGERHQLLVEWNATVRPCPEDTGVHQLFAMQALATPDRPAVVCEDETLSFHELDRRADRLAALLQRLGVTPEARVAICMERSTDLLVALLGTLKAGGAYVPLDPLQPASRLSFMMRDSGARVVLTQERLKSRLPKTHAEILCLDTALHRIAAEPVRPAALASSDQLAYAIYTSGSTGSPKAAAISHRAVFNLAFALQEAIYRRRDLHLRLSLNAPLAFDSSLKQLIQLVFGHTLYVIPDAVRMDGTELLACIHRLGLDVFDCTPSQLQLLLAAGLLRREQASPSAVLVGGEAISEELWQSLATAKGPRFFNAYGPTECTGDATVWPVTPDSAVPTLGRPLDNVQIYLLDPALQPVPVGMEGELCVAGLGLARGYLNQPGLTAERFVPHPFSQHPGDRLYRTGDLGRLRPDGQIQFLRRRDDQIKLRGFRVELGEIGSVLAQHPMIREAVAVLRKDPPGERLVAYAVPVPAGAPSVAELQAFVRERLPDYMMPAMFVLLDQMPLTSNGKLDRRALPDPETAAGRLRKAWLPPETPVEELLAQLWAGLLGVDRVGRGDQFFELGGHSLLATQLLSRLSKVFKVDLPLRTVFEKPVLSGLAAAIQEAMAAGTSAEVPPIEPVPRNGALPLSFAQERLWFLHRLKPESPAYNIPTAVRLRGRLEVPALAEALREIARRHEVLRTTFPMHDGVAVQLIAPEPAMSLPVVDLAELAADERERAARGIAAREARRPFDLAVGPLVRATVLRLADDDYVGLLNLHHIVSDAWSTGVLIRELGALYEAFVHGLPSPLPAFAIQYADYAHWQRQWLHGEALEAEIAYWKERLTGSPELLELPADRPRPAAQGFRGGLVQVAVPAPLVEEIRSLARKEGTTVFMVVLAAYAGLLSVYTEQEDVVIGSPIANRTRVEIEPLIGCFINTLALRLEAGGDPNFRTMLARARSTVLSAFAHSELPFERLVEALQPKRDLSHAPLFQTLLAWQNVPAATLALTALTLEPFEVERGTAKLDLALQLTESDSAITGWIEYSRDLFDGPTIARMAAHFKTLLQGLTAHPERSMRVLPLFSAAERHQVQQEWNDTHVGTAALQMPESFEARAASEPDRVAIEFADLFLTYGELDRQAERLARRLRAQGAGTGTLVGICLERSPRLPVALLGVLKAGGAYLPLDPSYPPERLAFMLDDSGVPIVVTETALAARFAGSPAELLDLDRDAAELAPPPAERPGSGPSPKDLAYVIYTSGSTGRPKGVEVCRGALANFLGSMRCRPGLDPADRLLAVTSPSFDIAALELFLPLAVGARIVLASREEAVDGRLLVSAWERAQATVLQATPATWGLLAAAGWPGTSPGLALCGGEELRPALAGTLASRGPVWNLYGPTETTVWSSLARIEEGPAGGAVSIGRPIHNTAIHVVDTELSPLPVGLRGELVIGGDGLARGYLGRPDLTAERFVPDPFSGRPGARLYRTGDLARWRPDGTLAFLGRRDHQVKVRGHRIELGEIEAALAACPGVREAVVVAQGEGSQRQLVAYVAGGGAPLSAAAVRATVAERLPAVMVPTVVLLDSLPRTPNGKIDRRALPALDRPDAETSPGSRAPRTPTEEILAGIWAAVLGRSSVSPDESFFEVGGHSLLAAQVVARVRELLGVELPVARIFEAPTVEAQAREIAAASIPDAPPLRPLPRSSVNGERWPLSFAQEGLWFFAQLDPKSTIYSLSHAVQAMGPLDLRDLRRALAAVVRRHEALWTTFGVEEGRGFQQLGTPWEPELPLVDLQGLAPDRRDAEVRQLAATEARRPFDLTLGPLLRSAVLRLGEAEHAILFSVHHIVADGWSMGLMVRDLAELYQAFREARAPKLPELSVQYADYAAWQRAWLSGAALERRLGFWREQLAGAPAVLDLPTDHPRSASGSHRGRRSPVRLGEPVSRPLRQLAQRSHATLFMALAAGFEVLLARYAGRDDLLLGAVTANRDRLGTEEVVGLFANTLVLRGDLSGEPTFLELLGRVRRTVLAAVSHGDVPFEKLVEELRPERVLGRSPLVQVVMVLQNLPNGSPRLPGLELRPLDIGVETAKFDLTLGLVEAGGEIAGALEHNRDLFEAATVERLIGHLGNLLRAGAEDPSLVVWDLPLLAEAERQQVLLEWNAPAPAGGPEALLHELFEAQTDRDPAAVAVVCGEERLGYRELEEHANRLAHYLRRLVGEGELVGLYLDRSLALPTSVLAVLKAGCAYVPLDPAYPKERLATVLEDAGISVLLTRTDLRQGLPETPARVVDLDAEGEAIARQPAARLKAVVPPEAPAYVIYTSGSTGRPKGCLISHCNVARLFAATADRFGFDARDVWTLFHSYAFDFSVWELWGALAFGGRLVIVPYWVSRSPEAFYALLAREGVTVLNQTPSAFRQLVQAEKQASPALREALRLRWVIFGGEALDLTGLAPWFDRHGDAVPALVNMYGITETTVHVTFRRVLAGDLAQAHRSPIGTAIGDLSLDLLDPFLHPVPVGMPGEMYVGGTGLALGYLDRPELTAARFVPDPFGRAPGARLYRSGDVARYRPDGDLDFLGRLDQQVKVRGFRIELGEVEAACARHPAVREVVVVARREDPDRTRLAAYLVPAPGRGLAVPELRRFLLERLPDYMVPSAFVLLDRLPRTPSGKLDRRALPDPRQEPRSPAGDAAPRQLAEEVLAAIWADLLGIPQPGIHDNFFELGGDSIVAIQVVARASRAGLHLTPRQLFEHQTIARLASVARTEGAITAEQGPVTGEVPLTPIQKRFFSWNLAEPHHYNQAVLLEVRQRPGIAQLETAIATLLIHHDALRLRFQRTEDVWRQHAVEPDGRAPFLQIDLSRLPEPAVRVALEDACAAVQGSFNLAAGPLLRAVLFDSGEDRPGRLLLAAHHLVVDGVSWRILLEDLQTSYEQACARQPLRLPEKTTSYKRWAERLTARARSEGLRELETWAAALPGLAPRLPLDDPAAPDLQAGAARVVVTLTSEETETLLRGTLAAFRSGIQEVLVTCVTLALAGWTGSRRVLLDLEGHGREEPADDMDLSRTVGWFTAIYPVELDLGEAVDPIAALKRAKEQLRAVPGGGQGYGLLCHLAGEAAARLPRREPEVSFNYLGQLDRTLGEDALLRPALERPGPPRSLRQRRPHRLELDSSISSGRLQMSWTYGAGHHRATIERAAAESLRFLRILIELGRSAAAAAFTPSDFPLARLDQRTLDLVAGNDHEIEDIYPLSPAQKGLLFHAVSAPGSGSYVYQMACRLEGVLDEDLFARAWQEVVARHPVLRTGFSWKLGDEPLQVVRRRVAAPVERLDWSGLATAEQRARLDDLLSEDRDRGFDPARPPLARLALARTGAKGCWLVWSCHHLVVDGWSVPILIREVLDLCDALAEGRAAALDRPRPYRDFVSWLADQDPSAAEEYWRRRLAGFRRPLPIGSHPFTASSGGTATHLARVPADLSGALEALGHQHRLTLATLLQGAWALLLGDLGRSPDVVFGGVVSGRPPELPGSEGMVGMFINTVPVRARIEPQAALLSWLAELQEQQLAAQTYAHVPLAEIRRWSEVPAGLPLFECTFAFNNYPTGGPLPRLGGGLAIAERRELEATSYALDLTVAAIGSELSLRVMYDPARFGSEEIPDLVGSLLALLAAMTERPEGRLSDCLAALVQRPLSPPATHRFKAVKPKAVILPEEEAR